VISQERVKEGRDAGVFFNVDPRTGKRNGRRKDGEHSIVLREDYFQTLESFLIHFGVSSSEL
jgi:hypothetical protein